jgi:peptidyl-prolyl cis-trans isomerase C
MPSVGHFHDEAEHDHVPFRFEGAPGEGRQIVVTEAKCRWLADRWEMQWRRSPTAEELLSMVEDFVREEVLYREALALGLDRDDLIVRRRLVQKMETLALEGTAELGDTELMEYFLGHRGEYRLPETVSFADVFFSAAARGVEAPTAARAALDELSGAGRSDSVGLGDPSSTPSSVTAWTHRQVGDRFGAEFATAVFEVAPGAWAGPIMSAYGQHLVLVSAHDETRLPEFAEVSGRVAADLDAQRRTGALNHLYEQVRANYEVVVDGDVPHTQPS